MGRKGNSDMEYLHDLVVRMDSRLDEMSETLVRNDENLKLHMKRSDHNEEAIEMLKKHVNMVHGVAVFIGLIATVASIAAVLK